MTRPATCGSVEPHNHHGFRSPRERRLRSRAFLFSAADKRKVVLNCEARLLAGTRELARFDIDPGREPQESVSLGAAAAGVPLRWEFGSEKGASKTDVRRWGRRATLQGNLLSSHTMRTAFQKFSGRLIATEFPATTEDPRGHLEQSPFPTLRALCDAQTRLTAPLAAKSDSWRTLPIAVLLQVRWRHCPRMDP